MSAQVFREIAEIREMLARVRRLGATVGLVPTMGALHEGHGRLIETARRQTDCVVVSIFVNPIQFDRKEDFERYPRPLDADLDFCTAHGADIVYAPESGEMYPEPPLASVEVARVSERLCGEFRPGHFRGVATVVLKLFNIIQPNRAYFGEKDAQQLAVIRRMTRDLNLPLEVIPVPTVREPDGLAMSSRNRLLTAEEREAAPAVFQALLAAQRVIALGAVDPMEVKAEALAVLSGQPRAKVEYLEVVDPEDMQPVRDISGAVRVAAAVWLGSTRLIDNMLCEPGEAASRLIQ
ncbi:MAG TPA: pantoate--beta-alanine ligase [Bryobacteraceae bacterium]|nr:pantoate--beta-alanine ligase [Bryobacteraceae bacterium]